MACRHIGQLAALAKALSIALHLRRAMRELTLHLLLHSIFRRTISTHPLCTSRPWSRAIRDTLIHLAHQRTARETSDQASAKTFLMTISLWHIPSHSCLIQSRRLRNGVRRATFHRSHPRLLIRTRLSSSTSTRTCRRETLSKVSRGATCRTVVTINSFPSTTARSRHAKPEFHQH
jgi:hypothetical protein